jgi:cobalt transporter subunit CbtB
MARTLVELRTLVAEGSLTALAAPVAAVLFGAFLLIGAGFAPLSIAHNAAHDGRHAFAFPCH